MDVVELTPRLHLLGFPVGHAYRWRDPGMPAGEPEPVRVDRTLEDGDRLGFGGGARVVGAPGHTDGSVAIFLPEHGVLCTGDSAARSPAGDVMLGVFNADPARAAVSFERLAGLDAGIACFGHGEPVRTGAAARLRAAVARTTGCGVAVYTAMTPE